MKNFIRLMPEQASTIAADIDLLFYALIGISVFFSILIVGLIIVFSIKFKRKSEEDTPEAIHGNLLLESIWTGIPLIIVMGLFFWGTALFVKSYTIPNDALEIFVVGKQWMWKIQHPEGPREINKLHVPVGKPIKLTMTSEDVIHSFFVPAFRVKMDVVPGKYSYAWFEATKPGSYHLFCTEYCGTKHSEMIGQVVVLEQDDYEKWLTDRVDPDGLSTNQKGLAGQGERLFKENRCLSCHSNASGAMGPNLAGLYNQEVKLSTGQTVTADENYIRESILKPNSKLVAGYAPLMPTFKNQLNEEEIIAIIEYIKSLKSPENAPGDKG